jgi:UDP-N-acetylmuramate--alanine ligase
MKKIHMVGIGGIGMSGLARILHSIGYKISGSDLQKNTITEEIKKLGIEIYQGHNPSNVPQDTSLVIKSAAVKEDNPEIVFAKEKGIEVLKYSQMLGKVMMDKTGIAIAGSHGKTTTTAIISFILQKAGLDPTFLCGGIVSQLGGNSQLGKGRYFVVEACEYDRTFLNLVPRAAVITNIEEDHLDYYKDIDEITLAFRDFAALTNPDGIVIGNLDNPVSANITKDFKERGESYSISQDTEWRARSIRLENNITKFEVLKYGKVFGDFAISLPGIHNVSNALASIAVANWAGVGKEIIQIALLEFKGIVRRLEFLGEKNGIIVMDDYGHHPTEIKATLKAIRERFPEKRIWCVFQPHQYSRTRIFLKEFSKSFINADVIILPEIYRARDSEEEVKRTSSKNLADLLDANGKAALYLPTFDEVVDFITHKIEPNSVLLTLGAGNVDAVAKRFLANV